MKIKFSLLATAALWVTGFGIAHATPASWSDTFAPNQDIFLSTTGQSTLSFTLDLTQGPNGFRPGLDTIDDAFLLILLTDDMDSYLEKVSFNFDGTGWQPSMPLVNGGFGPDLFPFSPLQFLDDGILTVSVKATKGDFFFNTALLSASGMQVPEPLSLGLFGIGLLALGMTRRRSVFARALHGR